MFGIMGEVFHIIDFSYYWL